MRTKLSLAIAAALLAGSVTVASAADMAVKARPIPPPPVYDWTGYWLGVGFGYMWGDSRQTFDPAGIVGAAVIPGGTVGPSIENPVVSLHATHTHQFKSFGWGSVVVGLDNSATMPLDNNPGPNGLNDGVVPCPNPLLNCGTRIQALFTTGAILGLAWDRVLLSVRGGYAGGLVETRRFLAAVPPAPGLLFDNTKAWHNGWYVGGGIDWAVYKTAGTSGVLGLEYQYVDLGDRVHCPTGCGVVIAGTARNVDVTANVIKAKFSVKFDGPPLLPF